MDEQRIEMVLKLLGECIPRAPEKTVEKMVKTVKALEEKRPPETADSKEEQPKRQANKDVGNKDIGGPKI